MYSTLNELRSEDREIGSGKNTDLSAAPTSLV